MKRKCLAATLSSLWNRLPFASLLFALLPLLHQSARTLGAPLLPPATIEVTITNGLPYLSVLCTNTGGLFLDLEISDDLRNWTTLGTFRNTLAPYADLTAPRKGTRYYRAREYTGTNNWSNQARDSSLDKFIILEDRPDLVYFHPSDLFHYQFATAQFPQFASLTPADFDAISTHPTNQEVVLGGLVSLGDKTGIEFISSEPFVKEELVRLYKTVAARIAIPGTTPFLIPSLYDQVTIRSNLDYFAEQGVPVHNLSELRPDTLVQSQGWSIGVLKYIPREQLAAAIAAGQVTTNTILVTDTVPRNLPPIAGLISLTASSPNSHTVLRLRSESLPYLDQPSGQLSEMTNLLGKRVLFATVATPPTSIIPNSASYPLSFYSPYRLIEFSSLPESVQSTLLTPRTNVQIQVPPLERYGSYVKDTADLTPSDARFFGSKAANYSLLRRAVPTNCQPAIAFSFDLWLDFMGQIMPTGKSLRDEINMRLNAISNVTDQTVVSANLKDIRHLIQKEARFSLEQQAAITNALSIFSPTRKIRFRSSSNAEDLPAFSAAGLYESHSGCLLDDLNPGPDDICNCDSSDDERRSVFEAIQKVYGSFYDDQAYAERRRFNVDESKTGMALLVHYSFPDETELANGVATATYNIFGNEAQLNDVVIVSQRGAESVTNPTGADLPETAQIPFGYEYPLLTALSTIPGPTNSVLDNSQNLTNNEYALLASMFRSIGQIYPWTNSPGVTELDFEFKKTTNGLVIKQVRPIYTGETIANAVFVPEKVTFETSQGPSSDIEVVHNLKSVWEFDSPGWAPNSPGSDSAPFTSARVTYISDRRIVTNVVTLQSGGLAGTYNIANWFSFTLLGAEGNTTNRYSTAGGDNFDASVFFPLSFPASDSIVAPSDISIIISRPGISGSVSLQPRTIYGGGAANIASTHVVVTAETNSVTFEARYWRGHSVSAKYVPTESLWGFDQTTISGLITQPIVLHGYFSETYQTSRHNFGEGFLLEPGLEEGISADLLNELREKDIYRIQVTFYSGNPFNRPYVVELIGFDGKHRPVPPTQ
jgi:hypothetical protein